MRGVGDAGLTQPPTKRETATDLIGAMKVELWSMPSGAVCAPWEELDLGVGELNLQSSVAGGSDDGGPPGEAGRKPERQRAEAAGSAFGIPSSDGGGGCRGQP
jgi:hypothetical protein